MTLLRGIFNEVLDERLTANNRKWKEDMDQRNRDLKREIRDETHSVVNAAVTASERRLLAKMDALESALRKDIHDVKDAVIDIIDESVLPEIEEHRLEILAIKRHVQMV